ncbi:hypothetical protein O9G_002482 [Rozella allomycis CSF55]|uniref:Uncharacterized protein n=1 Tax=Rozella allomycis (strain CSF55) TaxID=988480 RepID=A0A075AZB1_ROZAC|nr:hypothetical protein O9G_002482 [Rozella allomycis CSF55]|eukprot:EPZ33919.1 hypothetical protein O9G_002482 [Rozella allomycis CSF55]
MDGNLVLQSVYSDSPFTNTYKASLKKLFRCLRGSPYDYVSSDRRYHFIVPVEKFKQDCLESEFATEFELNSLSQVLDFVKMSVEIKSSDPSEFFDTEIFKVLGKRLKLYLSFKTDCSSGHQLFEENATNNATLLTCETFIDKLKVH